VRLVLDRPTRYQREVAELERLCALGSDAAQQVFTIGPGPDDPPVSRLCRDRVLLAASAAAGGRAVYRSLGLDAMGEA
jgi:hypothetical protein